ncbi:MAG: hypothetical protein K6T71_06710 [Candidatus Bipolaricaulota bacterium]|nr:hypothetical protein [Candidatus Bipolaricaulota bacterium]
MKSACVAVLVCLGVLAVGASAQAQGQSPLYYGTQIGGGTIAALGATVGYNAKVGLAISATAVNARF